MRDLLWSFHGRCRAADCRWAALFVLSIFTTLFLAVNAVAGWTATWILYPPAYWALTAIFVKRYHDLDRSGWRLLWVLVPLLGPMWVGWSLFWRRGRRETNRYGANT